MNRIKYIYIQHNVTYKKLKKKKREREKENVVDSYKKF